MKQNYCEIEKNKLFAMIKTIIDNNGIIVQVINVDDKYMIIFTFKNLI